MQDNDSKYMLTKALPCLVNWWHRHIHSKLGQSHYANCLGVLRILVRGTKRTDAMHSLKSLVEMKNYSLRYSSRACFYYALIKTSDLACSEHCWMPCKVQPTLKVCTVRVKNPWGDPAGSILGHSHQPLGWGAGELVHPSKCLRGKQERTQGSPVPTWSNGHPQCMGVHPNDPKEQQDWVSICIHVCPWGGGAGASDLGGCRS